MADGRRSFEEYSIAARLRDVIAQLVTKEIQRQRPRVQYATVVSFNRAARTAVVQYPGDAGTQTVGMGSVQPSANGQVVRVEGIVGDRYIADVMGAAYFVGTVGA